jgi:hypothetical protein
MTAPRSGIASWLTQVQGLMAIFDRECCNLYVWIPASPGVRRFKG